MATLNRIWAVALLTFREAIRKRVLLVLIIFGITILSVFALMPEADSTTRLRVLEMWMFRAMTLFVSIIAVFLAGFSLPGDIERRQIYMLASKPISKMTILFGKYVGFILVTAVVILLMTIFGALVFRLTQDSSSLVSYPQHFVDRAKHRNITLLHGNWWLRGEKKQNIEMHFTGLEGEEFDEFVRARVRVSGGGESEMFDYTFRVLIRVLHPDYPDDDSEIDPQAWKSQNYDTQAADAVHNEWQDFTFPKRFIDASGRVRIRITNDNAEYLYVHPEDLSTGKAGIVLLGSSGLFEFNFAKAGVLLLIQTLLVLTVSVAASSFLSGQVSALLGIVVLLIGNLTPFLSESVHDVDQYSVQRMEADPHGHNDTGLPPWLVKASTYVSKVVLNAKVFPDLSGMSGSDYLLEDFAIPWRAVLAAFYAILIHLLVLLILSYWLVRLRDFA